MEDKVPRKITISGWHPSWKMTFNEWELLTADKCWWKMTLDGIQRSKEDYLCIIEDNHLKTAAFDEKLPSIKDYLQWRTIFDGNYLWLKNSNKNPRVNYSLYHQAKYRKSSYQAGVWFWKILVSLFYFYSDVYPK